MVELSGLCLLVTCWFLVWYSLCFGVGLWCVAVGCLGLGLVCDLWWVVEFVFVGFVNGAGSQVLICLWLLVFCGFGLLVRFR